MTDAADANREPMDDEELFDEEIPEEDLPDEEEQPESQGEDPLLVELGEEGEGDVSPSDV